MKIVESDNYGGDYPDEHFVPYLPVSLDKLDADTICRICNSYGEGHSPRYLKSVPDDYKLQPGFEP